MIQKFINKYFFYLYVFTLFFGVLLYNTTGFKGLDIASSLILLVFYGIFLIGAKNRKFNLAFLAVVAIFLFYLNYSFYISYNTRNAIAMDFLTQLRPYLTFFIILQMSPQLSEKQKGILKKIVFYTWLLFIPIGLYALLNSSFLSILMDKPSNYTACITALSIVYLYCSNFSIKDKLTFVFMLSMGLITTHSQFYIFFLIVCGLIMFFHHADVLKSNWKTGIAMATIACLVIFVSRAEISNYLFPAGLTGGGFASLATSSGFSTQLNEGINPLSSFINQEWFSNSVSYYPVLAQLGLIGILLYLSFWGYILATSIIQFKRKGDIQPFIIVLMLVVFIFIENLTDSFFTSNKGYFMMMFIGLLLSKPEEVDQMMMDNINGERKKKRKQSSAVPIIRIPGNKFFFWEKKVPLVKENVFAMPQTPVAKPEPVVVKHEVDTVPVAHVEEKNEYHPNTQIVSKTSDNQSNVQTVAAEIHEVSVPLIEDTVKESAPVQTVEVVQSATAEITVHPAAEIVLQPAVETTVQPVAEISEQPAPEIHVQPVVAVEEEVAEDEWDDIFEDEDEWDDDFEFDEEEDEEVAEIKAMTEVAVASPEPIKMEESSVAAPVMEVEPIIEVAPEEDTNVFVAMPVETVQEVVAPEVEIQEVAAPVAEVVIPMIEVAPDIEENEVVIPVAEAKVLVAPPVEAVQEVVMPKVVAEEIAAPVAEVVTPVIEVAPKVEVKEAVTPVAETKENIFVSPFSTSFNDDEMVFVSPIEYIEAESMFAMPAGDIYESANKFASAADEVFEFTSPIEVNGADDTLIYNRPSQYTEAIINKPAVAATEQKPAENVLNKAKQNAEDNDDSDFAEDMFTYMI